MTSIIRFESHIQIPGTAQLRNRGKEHFYDYSTQESDRVLIILNWLDQEGLRFVLSLKDEEKEMCRKSKGLFKVLYDKFKPVHST